MLWPDPVPSELLKSSKVEVEVEVRSLGKWFQFENKNGQKIFQVDLDPLPVIELT